MCKKLNLGCGKDILKDYINLDKKDFDLNIFPYPYKNNIFEEVLLKQVLEHLDKPRKVIKELLRILKPQGILRIEVPHYTNKGAYTDMEHQHFFDERCFEEFNPIVLETQPTFLGRYLGKWLRDKLSLVFNGLKGKIIVEITK